jgi:hypothetical protein
MSEADQWRQKAQAWSAMAQSSGDEIISRVLSDLAAEALNLANYLDAEVQHHFSPDHGDHRASGAVHEFGIC